MSDTALFDYLERDFSKLKFGKGPKRNDSRTIQFRDYATAGLPAPLQEVKNTRGIVDFGMLKNDVLGCCTVSGAGHAVQVLVMTNIVPASPSGIIHPSDDIIERYYSSWCGYNPTDPSTDRGGIELDVLNNWRKHGFAGYGLQAFVEIDHRNETHVKQAIQLFGGVYVGMELPDGWANSQVWDANMGRAGSMGGHCVYCPNYTQNGIDAITWGFVQPMTWRGFSEYCSECYVLLSPDMKRIDGWDYDRMLSELTSATA